MTTISPVYFDVQVKTSFTARECDWITVYTVYTDECGGVDRAALDIEREVKWISETPAQYGHPTGIRVLADGKPLATKDLCEF